MRILSCTLEHFASYQKLDFDFTGQGLALIQGPTGAGKSTLCDAIPWILFGKTAKGGAVDEVLSWPGDKAAYGSLSLELPSGTMMHVYRTRGKAKDNDLYYQVHAELGPLRGKDIPDTQRIINGLLSMNYETYLAGAYYHEFSQTAQFFNTTAKNRRQITEQLVDLSLATELHSKSQEAKKIKDKILNDATIKLRDLDYKVETLTEATAVAKARADNYEKDISTSISATKIKFDKFESTRQIDLNEARRTIQVWKGLLEVLPETDLFPKCVTCGQNTHGPELEELRRKSAINDNAKFKIQQHSERIKEIKLRVNPYAEEKQKTEVNPYIAEVKTLMRQTTVLLTQIETVGQEKQRTYEDSEDLLLLQEVLADYRSTTIKNAICGLQDNTNKLLSDHFDAEIRVEFEVQDADKLEVIITKDGNTCVFSQLSKGQRCLLKLCFGVSVMKAVANHNGIQFYQVFFDEALDGLDDTNKIKAFGLLSTIALSYDSVFCVEHSEALKALFDNAYTVSLINGTSIIEKS